MTAAYERITLASLAPLSCWVAWQVEARDGGTKPAKVPRNPHTGGKAKADTPGTWGTREQAERRAATLPRPFKLGGVGVEFTLLDYGRHLSGIDLDSCRCPVTGVIEPWAQAVLDRFATYVEVSPSGTGVKAFFLHRVDDHERLRAALGVATGGRLKYGTSWARRSSADHPPAVELHLGNRFFAVTDDALPGSTDELREVSADELLHLIRVVGPAFATGASPDDEPNADMAITKRERSPRAKRGIVGIDQSRSGAAFRIGARARRQAGADYITLCEAIRIDPKTAEWYQEKGTADGGRELRRIWEKTDPLTGTLILSEGAPLVSAREFIRRMHTLDAVRTLHHQNACFYSWAQSHYVENAPEEMRAAIYRFLDGARLYNRVDELVAFDPTKAKVANVLEATAAEAQLSGMVRPPAWVHGDGPNPAEIIACRNGLLHLPTSTLHAHTPAFFTLNALAFDYQPAAPKPTAWLAFLNSIWPDDADATGTLQEYFGLCLTADTSHQKAFLIVGPKRSGKGTIARVLTELLGTSSVCSPTLSSLSQNFGLSPMIGKRLAIVSDARLSGKSDQAVIAERLLAITGEDRQTVDRKFLTPWTGKLDVRFLVLTNELPRLADSSGALASRFIVLTMLRSFFGKEDRGLLSQLTHELPGILLWAIEGWRRLTERGHFVPPKSSAEAMQELDNLGSPIGAFLRDRCMVGQGHSVSTTELYTLWCKWCAEHGRDHPGSTQTFGRDLRAAVPGLKDTQPRTADGSRERYYEGVGLDPSFIVARAGTRATALCSR